VAAQGCAAKIGRDKRLILKKEKNHIFLLRGWKSARMAFFNILPREDRGSRGSDMLLDEIHSKREVIERLGRQYGARRIRVFGSVARREERIDSDVDFLVDFPRGYDLFAQRLPLTEELADLLQRRVELIPEHELNRHIRERVMQEAVDL
jgi:uncharacterized protein